MSKKLERNGLWESSRMMLPDHKETYIAHQQQLDKKKRPVLDEQEIEMISYLIAQSMLTGEEIMITVFEEFQEREIIGRVVKVDQQKREIKLDNGVGFQWVKFEHLIRARDI